MCFFIIYSFIWLFILCFACVWMRERVCCVVHLMNKYITSKWKLFISFDTNSVFLCIEILGWFTVDCSVQGETDFLFIFTFECIRLHNFPHKHINELYFASHQIPFLLETKTTPDQFISFSFRVFNTLSEVFFVYLYQ